jgi:hypothetical protein
MHTSFKSFNLLILILSVWSPSSSWLGNVRHDITQAELHFHQEPSRAKWACGYNAEQKDSGSSVNMAVKIWKQITSAYFHLHLKKYFAGKDK